MGPCYYGIDTPTKRELIASTKSVDEIRRFIGADSLGYLSLEAMLDSVEANGRYCCACFTDRYPTDVTHEEKQKELFGKSLGRTCWCRPRRCHWRASAARKHPVISIAIRA